jgi:hypothetical protein
MQLTRSLTIRLFQIFGISLLVGVIIGYAIWRSFAYASGPKVEIYEPANGALITLGTITIKGRAVRINNLTMNGNTVSVDEQGNFAETLIVFPGLNKITFVGTDQFARSVSKIVQLVGESNPRGGSSIKGGSTNNVMDPVTNSNASSTDLQP